MTLIFGLWLLSAVSELVLYKYLPTDKIRAWWAAITLLLLMSTSTILLLHDWPVWLAAWILSWYRTIGLLRVIEGRLPRAELQRISLRALGWLLVLQGFLTGLSWMASQHHKVAAYGFDVLVSLQALVILVMLRVTINTWWHTRPNLVEATLADKELPSVSVLIPARDETEALQACLASLVASDYPKLEIVVLDDCSASRRTPDIIRSFAHDGVRFIQGEAPDESRWLAKNQAYERLTQAASGDVLLFCGVDLLFAPGSIRQLVELLLRKEKDMMSIMPLRAKAVQTEASLLQPMRYFWELCPPRRFFKRPPVLSTCWVIRTKALEACGGFAAVSRSVIPEAHFARQAVIGDRYSFLRADEHLGVVSTKPAEEQYATTVRTRYPQLHRRVELVSLVTLAELFFLLGPLIGLAALWVLPHKILLSVLWVLAIACLEIIYYLVAVRTKLNSPMLGWVLFPVAIITDIAMLHISLWKYEFGQVAWKGRNVCVPVMRVEPRLPKLRGIVS